MDYINDWHDVVRVVAFLVNIYTLWMLGQRYWSGAKEWNSKTIDLWYALTMWTLTGAVFAAQGVILDRPFTPGFVFLTAATLVGGKGIHSKGQWGGKGA